MDNRVSLMTLGVADISRARAFSEALWKGQSPDGDVVFFQAGGHGPRPVGTGPAGT